MKNFPDTEGLLTWQRAAAGLACVGACLLGLGLYATLPFWWGKKVDIPDNPVLPPPVQLSPTNDEALARFLAAYEPAARALERRFGRNRHLRLWQSRYDGDNVTSRQEADLLLGQTCLLCRVTSLVRTDDVAGEGGHVFRVVVHEGKPRPSWTLVRPDGVFVIQSQGPDGAVKLQEADGFGAGYLKSAAVAHWRQLVSDSESQIVEVVRKPTVAVLELDETEWRGRRVTRLRCQELVEGNGEAWLREVNYYFDAPNGWLLCGIERGMDKTGGTVHIARLDYHFDPDGPRPVRIERWHEQWGRPQWGREVTEFLTFEAVEPDPCEFSLQRFGLPEPGPWPPAAPSTMIGIPSGVVTRRRRRR